MLTDWDEPCNDFVKRAVRESRALELFEHIDAHPAVALSGVSEIPADAMRVPIREALRVAVIVKHTPGYGKPLGRDVLEGARSCKFDADGHAGKPRFRLVYDVLPDGVRVLAIGRRETVYPTATLRAEALQQSEWPVAA